MVFGEFEPKISPLNSGSFSLLVEDGVGFDARNLAFQQTHPSAEEFVIITREGLDAEGRGQVKQLVLDNTGEGLVYAGFDGSSVLRNGKLIDPEDEASRRFHDLFYATTRSQWEGDGLTGDMNPLKHAVIKARTGLPTIAVYDRAKLNPFEDDPLSRSEANSCWVPSEGFTTETALDSLFYVVSLRKLMAN